LVVVVVGAASRTVGVGVGVGVGAAGAVGRKAKATTPSHGCKSRIGRSKSDRRQRAKQRRGCAHDDTRGRAWCTGTAAGVMFHIEIFRLLREHLHEVCKDVPAGEGEGVPIEERLFESSLPSERLSFLGSAAALVVGEEAVSTKGAKCKG
jgi:hypothetical protein